MTDGKNKQASIKQRTAPLAAKRVYRFVVSFFRAEFVD